MMENTLHDRPEDRHLPALQHSWDSYYLYAPHYRISSNDYTYPSYIDGTDRSSGTGLEDLMNRKRDVIQSKIHMVLSEIYQRRQLKERNIYQICCDQCSCRNLIYLVGDMYMDRRRIELERKIIDLEQEKRREKSGYFRDILFLKKELRESLIEHLEEQQKADMFINGTEELPCNP